LDNAVFGARIRQAREDLGLSQEELAARVSKSQKAISQYENGTRRMFVNDLEKFANALQVPLSFFLTGQIVLDEVDELIVTETKRLSSLEAKQTLLNLVKIFCDFAERIDQK
jgi:transcriptional regulator with XRE-family HTH domain